MLKFLPVWAKIRLTKIIAKLFGVPVIIAVQKERKPEDKTAEEERK